MNTITVIAHNRPEYLVDVVVGLIRALDNCPGFFDLVVFSVEPNNPATVEVLEKAVGYATLRGIGAIISEPDIDMGVGRHHLEALKLVFDTLKSDFNVLIEDDAVLMKDALQLARWFAEKHGDKGSKYTLLSMCHHQFFGRGYNPGGILDDPTYVLEALQLTSPFAWAATKHQWSFIRDTWDFKKVNPRGWDYSLSMAMGLTGRRALHPVVSRCKNIGRIGVNSTSEMFDETQIGLLHLDDVVDSDTSGLTPCYVLVGRYPDDQLFAVQPWMLNEIKLMTGELKP